MQFFLSILLAPLNSLPFLQDAFVLFTSIPSTIANGGRCLAGINSIVNHTIVDADGFAHGSCWSDKNNKWGAPSDSHCDDCVGAWLPTFFYIVFNCSYNLFIVRCHSHTQRVPASARYACDAEATARQLRRKLKLATVSVEEAGCDFFFFFFKFFIFDLLLIISFLLLNFMCV